MNKVKSIRNLSELPSWIDGELSSRHCIPAHWIDKFWRKRGDEHLLRAAREHFIETANEIIAEHNEGKPGLIYREIFSGGGYWKRIRFSHGPGRVLEIQLNGDWIYDIHMYGWNEKYLSEIDACMFNSRSLCIRPLMPSDVITVTYQTKAK